MPTFGGASALALFNSFGLEIPFIVVSGTVTEELAVRAMRSGARDFGHGLSLSAMEGFRAEKTAREWQVGRNVAR
jgi:hypothetical protein